MLPVFRDLLWGCKAQLVMLNCVALTLFLVLLSDLMAAKVAAFPAPFTRVLTLKEPPIEGKQDNTIVLLLSL